MDISSYHLHYVFFFFNDTATTEIYTLSLHDALPIFHLRHHKVEEDHVGLIRLHAREQADRKSTRLNSSHTVISYAVFCLKKKKNKKKSRRESITLQSIPEYGLRSVRAGLLSKDNLTY